MQKRIMLVMTFILYVVISSGMAAETVHAQDEAYRAVKVLETVGDAWVERGEKEIPVYEEMVLLAGDVLRVSEGSQAGLLLDDDKYVIVEENSRLSFELEGDKKKGAIRIFMEEGAIFSDVRNKLEEEDCYEVHTPNSVMAVRGTHFWVSVSPSLTEGENITRAVVLKGRVEVITIGNVPREQLLLAGEESIIQGRRSGEEGIWQGEFIKRQGEIDPETLPLDIRFRYMKWKEENEIFCIFDEFLRAAKQREEEHWAASYVSYSEDLGVFDPDSGDEIPKALVQAKPSGQKPEGVDAQPVTKPE